MNISRNVTDSRLCSEVMLSLEGGEERGDLWEATSLEILSMRI